jgi:hypothetical protein
MDTTTQTHPPLAKQGWYRRNEIAVTPWLFLAARADHVRGLCDFPNLPELSDLTV